MSEFFRAAVACGWIPPVEKERRQAPALAQAMLQQEKKPPLLGSGELVGTPPRWPDVLEQEGRAAREAHRTVLLGRARDLAVVELEREAAHRKGAEARQRRLSAEEAERAAFLGDAVGPPILMLSTGTTGPAEAGHSLVAGSTRTSPAAGGAPLRPSSPPTSPALERAKEAKERLHHTLPREARREHRLRLGESFLLDSSDGEEEVEQDCLYPGVSPGRGRQALALRGLHDAVLDTAKLPECVTPAAVVLGGEGAASVTRRHRIRPRSVFTRKNLNALIDTQLQAIPEKPVSKTARFPPVTAPLSNRAL